jgi:hypothetical protein
VVTTIAYLAVLAAVFAYLALYGGRTGLWGGALLIGTSMASLTIAVAFAGSPLAGPLLAVVDVMSLAWKLALAFLSNRRWPIWVAAFQVNVVAAHVSVWLVPTWRGELYYAMITVWAIPTLLAMLIGTALDNRMAKTPGAGGQAGSAGNGFLT